MAHAGAWGPGNFENDTALDWVADCIHKPGIKALEAALTLPAQAQTIDDDDGIEAIAAAEVVAAATGKPARQLPAELRDWLARQTKADILQLLPRAKAALIRVKKPRESELAKLWSGPGMQAWLANVSELEARLQK